MTDREKSASAGVLAVIGYSATYSTDTSSPRAAAMPRATRGSTCAALAWASGEKVRTVASTYASSGITFRFVPARNTPTVTTIGSKIENSRVTVVCSAVTSSAAAGTGSLAPCGADPCPPLPRKVTAKASEAASIVPGLVANRPYGSSAEKTCMPYAASTRRPAASSTPSSTMTLPPPKPSSPGWNISTTSPGSSARRADSSRAAPMSIAVCRSWPQACMAPSMRLR